MGVRHLASAAAKRQALKWRHQYLLWLAAAALALAVTAENAAAQQQRHRLSKRHGSECCVETLAAVLGGNRVADGEKRRLT